MRRFALGSLVALGILVPVTFVPAQDQDTPVPTTAQQADTVWIEIVADGDSIAARPDSMGVKRGQAVGWRSELGIWRVFFRSDQPFGPGAVNQGLGGNQGQRRGWAVRSQAPLGSYKYDIQVVIPGQGPIRVDPEIVVEEEGER